MNDEWVICKGCSLKYRARESSCPRCERPGEEEQVRWTEERGPGAGPPRSNAWKIASVMVVLLGAVGGGAYFGPGLLANGPAQKIARACESKSGVDCTCVGAKTLELMNPEQRQAAFDPEVPATRELILTAADLCLKARLVARCVASKQGSELQCVCLMGRAVDSFTPAELVTTLEQVAIGAAPARYAAIRTDCFSRIP